MGSEVRDEGDATFSTETLGAILDHRTDEFQMIRTIMLFREDDTGGSVAIIDNITNRTITFGYDDIERLVAHARKMRKEKKK